MYYIYQFPLLSLCVGLEGHSRKLIPQIFQPPHHHISGYQIYTWRHVTVHVTSHIQYLYYCSNNYLTHQFCSRLAQAFCHCQMQGQPAPSVRIIHNNYSLGTLMNTRTTRYSLATGLINTPVCSESPVDL